MKYIKLISIIFIILSAFFLGCVQPQVSTPAPTATPTATAIETVKPTVVQTAAPSPTPTASPRTPVVYKSSVDDSYGFFRVIALNSSKPAPYTTNNTLTINVGDEVIWSNDVDQRLTIVSEQGLWNNTSAVLLWQYREFNYTFTQPGEYGIYIREYPRERMKILVKP